MDHPRSGSGDTPPRIVGFDNEARAPRRALRLWPAVAATAIVAAVLAGFAAAFVQLTTLRSRVPSLQSAAESARQAAARADRAARAAAEAARSAAEAARAARASAGASQAAAARADRAIASSERAVVAVDRIALRRLVQRRHVYWVAAPVAQNIGNTPTRDLHHVSRWGFDAPTEAPALAGSESPPPDAAAAAIAARSSVYLPGPRVTARARGRTLYLHGTLSYRDVFSGEPHLLWYCYYANIPRHPGRGFRPRFAPCVHLNCADRGCAGAAGG